MKAFAPLSVLAVLAAFTSSPVLSSAQAVSVAQASAPALPFYAQLTPLASSSSGSNAFFYDSRTQASKPAPAPSAEVSTRPFSSVGVGFKIGIGGIGFDVATPLVPGHLNIRGGAGFFSYTYNGTVSNEPVNATLNLNNAEAMVDWFPFKGSFRLSAGSTVYNQTGLNGGVTVAGGTNLKIGNNTYTSSVSAPLYGNLAVGFGSKAVPRVTLGWGNMTPLKGHIKVESEFGVEIIGTPTVAWSYGGSACLDNNSGTCSTPYEPISSIPGVSADIAAQTSSLQSDLNNVKVFPVFSIGLSYKIGR
jgi:hypothetical protein